MPQNINTNLFDLFDMKTFLNLIALVFFTASFGQCPEGDVVLFGQPAVDNFEVQYPNCQAIEGFLIIQGNDIVDLSPLSQINAVGSLLINDTSLSNMQGLDAITITGLSEQDAFIVIDNNPMFQDILFLNNYTVNVPVVFLVRDMPALTSLEGAGNITEFITLYLENNDQLSDLNGLNENLNIIGGLVQDPVLYIREHASLSDISRLNTAQLNNSLTAEILNNTQLAVCENDLVCSLIENNAILIENNALGCNSNAEVEIACESLSLGEFEEELFKIYPNPVSGILFVDGLNNENFESLKIYSSTGEKILETNTHKLDLTAFQSGVYFIKITTKQGSLTKLVIKA